jgi:hypothetical protein
MNPTTCIRRRGKRDAAPPQFFSTCRTFLRCAIAAKGIESWPTEG